MKDDELTPDEIELANLIMDVMDDDEAVNGDMPQKPPRITGDR